MGAAAKAGTTAGKAGDTGKAPARKAADKNGGEGGEGGAGTGAPRPRKHDYGITDDAAIVMKVAEEKVPAMRGDMTGFYTAASKSKIVAEYYENGGTRAGLRRLMRRGIIGLKGADGTEYPRGYVAPEKPEPKAPKGGDAAAA